MLEGQLRQEELTGQALLDDLAKKGYGKILQYENIIAFSDGKENVFYNTKTQTIVCRTIVYKKGESI